MSRQGSQVIPLAAPPVAELPCWGRRIDFRDFLVELVPEGERVFNARLSQTFASINFGPAEGTSSLAGDRLRRYDRRPYEFVLVPPLFPLKGETQRAPEVLAFVIDVDSIGGMLAEALAVEVEALRPEVVIGSPNPFIATLARRIRVQLGKERPPKRYVESLCTALLVEMFRPIAERRLQEPEKARVDGQAIDMLLAYIDANLDGDLVIDSLAELLGVSADRLGRLFKKAVGDSPHNYVIQRRIDAARRLLASGDRSLAEIALDVGFSSQSHMTTAFKKVLGVTPGLVRKQSRAAPARK